MTRRVDRLWLAILFGFSTQILWVTTRGGVWHTGHLVATILTFACLIELRGSRRAWLIGLLAGAAFLTRAPLAFAIPVLRPVPGHGRRCSIRGAGRGGAWIGLGLGVAPALIAFFAYNQVRFGSLVRVGLRAGDPAALPRGPARTRPVLDRAHPDEPGLLPGPSPVRRSRGAVLPAGRAGHVGAHHEPGAAPRVPRRLARRARSSCSRWRRCSCSSRRCSTTAAAGCSTATATSSTRCRSSSACAAWPSSIAALGVGWKAAIAFGVVVMVVGVYWAYLI